MLRKIGVPTGWTGAIILAGLLTGGVALKNLKDNFRESKVIFPDRGYVNDIKDGDTFGIRWGLSVRLVGVNAPDRGEKGYEEAKMGLAKLIKGKTVWLEYDRYLDEKHVRLLAWVWVGCEKTPIFLPADYMHLSNNQSRPGLTDNPEGCKKGKLVQEELIKAGLAKIEVYKDRGELKYEERLR
mgnify:FL=1